MSYRILLMVSGLFMMFTVFGLVMTIGALVDESDVWIGNLTIGCICGVIMLATFAAGMRMRKKVHALTAAVIESLFTEHGHIEAIVFAKGAGVSLDEARDVLDKHMHKHGWQRTELELYNAVYRRENG